MDMQDGVFIVGASAALALAVGATWFACRWWYSRKLLAAAQRLHKSDQGRHFANQQTMQARRQIETLKAELAELQEATVVQTQASRQRTREHESTRLVAELADDDEPTPMPLAAASHGFADTQLMP
ncbi:MAG: hypothetical protein ABI641_07610 [Caldimonas sp.]